MFTEQETGKADSVGGHGERRDFETCKVTCDMGLWTQAWWPGAALPEGREPGPQPQGSKPEEGDDLGVKVQEEKVLGSPAAVAMPAVAGTSSMTKMGKCPQNTVT